MPPFRVGKPRLKVVPASNHTLAASFQLAIFDQVEFDDVGGWDGQSTYTFDRPGLWLAGTQCRREATSPSTSLIVRLQHNGVNVYSNSQLSTGSVVMGGVVGLLDVDRDDTLAVEVRLNSSASATLAAVDSWLWVTRVGPERWT